jgi:hypothetical protein
VGPEGLGKLDQKNIHLIGSRTRPYGLQRSALTTTLTGARAIYESPHYVIMQISLPSVTSFLLGPNTSILLSVLFSSTPQST